MFNRVFEGKRKYVHGYWNCLRCGATHQDYEATQDNRPFCPSCGDREKRMVPHRWEDIGHVLIENKQAELDKANLELLSARAEVSNVREELSSLRRSHEEEKERMLREITDMQEVILHFKSKLEDYNCEKQQLAEADGLKEVKIIREMLRQCEKELYWWKFTAVSISIIWFVTIMFACYILGYWDLSWR